MRQVGQPSPPHNFQLGMRYRVERLLGRGGFGDVYLAHDQQLDRPCVVKRLRLDPSWDHATREQIVQSFVREARLLVTLNSPGHPHIPEIYQYLAPQQCVVIKYIEGQSLAQQLVASNTPFDEQDALGIVRDVCSALVYMHTHTPEPVLHRDIKPDNMLRDRIGRVWLIDFGSTGCTRSTLATKTCER